MKKIKIGLAGLGTVGRGVYEILTKNKKLLTAKSNAEFEIVAVSARNKKDFIDPKIPFYTNAVDLANDSNVDVVVEVIGGDVIAKNLAKTVLENGKKLVTANKALIAQEGEELSRIAEKSGSKIWFEAAVAGAIPIIKVFKECFAGDEIKEFYAILNGTCNFILTKMKDENLDFVNALKQAQDLGYAESDPTFDVEGIDTAHKLAILAAIASGAKPAFKRIHVEGINLVSIEDIRLADELGYKIKLLAVYKNHNKSCKQAVYPALIKKSEKIAQVDGAFNAIATNLSNAGWNFVVGSGAGSLPTASSIISDLIDIANDRSSPMFGMSSNLLKEANILKLSDNKGKYFLNLLLKTHIMPAQNEKLVSTIFDKKFQIEQISVINENDNISCGLITADYSEVEILSALQSLDSKIVKSFKFLRVETINF